MNKKNCILIMILLLFFVLFGKNIFYRITTINNEDNDDANDDKNLINETELSDFSFVQSDAFTNNVVVLKVGEKISLNIDYCPTSISEFQKRLIWTISDNNVVSVNNKNEIKGLKVGEAILTATSSKNRDIYKSIKVKVVEESNLFMFSAKYSNKKNIFGIGQVVKLDYIIEGKISSGDIEWFSSNEDVATIDNGYLKCLSLGNTTITATSLYDTNYSITLDIAVQGRYVTVEPEQITLSKLVHVELPTYDVEVSLDSFLKEKKHVGYIITLGAETSEETCKATYFEFEDPSMVKVYKNDNSTVRFECIKPGKLVFYAISSYFTYLKQEFSFDVLPYNYNNSFDIKLFDEGHNELIDDNDSYSADVNRIFSLEVFSNDVKIDNSYLTVSSSNNEIVAIDNNYLKILSNGNADITIKDKYNDSNNKKIRINAVDNNVFIPITYFCIKNSLLNNTPYILSEYDQNNFNVGDKLSFEVNCYPYYSTNYYFFDVIYSDVDSLNIEKKVIDDILFFEITFLKPFEDVMKIESIENREISNAYSIKCTNRLDLDFSFINKGDIERGESFNVDVAYDGKLSNVSVSYESSNPDVASIGPYGDVVGLDIGQTNITIRLKDGIKSIEKNFDLKINEEKNLYDELDDYGVLVSFNGEIIDLSEKFFNIGDKFSLSWFYSPNNYSFGNLNDIIVEDESILNYVKEDDHYIFTTISAGKTKITIKPYANAALSISYEITVINTLPQFLCVSFPYEKVYVDDIYQFGYLVDWRATYKKVDVSVEDDSIAEIKNDYLLIKNPGKTKLNFIIDDNDENTISYVYSVEVNAIKHDTKVLLARYGYDNLLYRILFQGLCWIGLAYFITVLFKQICIKNSIKCFIVMGIGLLSICILFFIRKYISFFGYEKFDALINIGCFIITIIILFMIDNVQRRKEHE